MPAVLQNTVQIQIERTDAASCQGFPQGAPGIYTLAIGLVDRRAGLQPGLDVAVDPACKQGKWVKVSNISIR